MERDVLKRSVVLWVKEADEVSVARVVADQRTVYRLPIAVCRAILGSSLSRIYERDGRANPRAQPSACTSRPTDAATFRPAREERRRQGTWPAWFTAAARRSAR